MTPDLLVAAFLIGMLTASGLIELVCFFGARNRELAEREAERTARPSSLPTLRLVGRR